METNGSMEANASIALLGVDGNECVHSLIGVDRNEFVNNLIGSWLKRMRQWTYRSWCLIGS